jgi:diguanylate cyclase (GGDEF)-like protein
MGRLLSILYIASGLVTMASPLLPSPPSVNRGGVMTVGVIAIIIGSISWFLPWHRWPRSAGLWSVAPVSQVLIGVHNYYGGTDPYRYGLFFMVAYMWIGVSQRRWMTFRLAPLTLLVYVVPLLLTDRPAWAIWSVLYAMPIFLLVGESIAWLAEELRGATVTLEFHALHDPLTGLVNRVVFEERLTSTAARGREDSSSAGVVFVDVDNFKHINDTLGHDAGDDVLTEVARRLRQSVRDSDTVARLGGDEFVVLIDGDAGRSSAIADRIRASLAEPFTVEGRTLRVTASVGMATGASADVEELLRRSDEAMYAAKPRRARPTTTVDQSS